METWQMWYMHRTENPANEVQLLESPLYINMETWQMWYMHRTENPANEVQLLESPLYIAQYAQVGKIGKAATLRM